MILSFLLVLAAIIPVDAYVRPDGSLYIDQVVLNVSSAKKGFTLKSFYTVDESKTDTRTFSLGKNKNGVLFECDWTWNSLDANTIEGILNVRTVSDVDPKLLSHILSFPLITHSKTTWESNGIKHSLNDIDFYHKEKAKELNLNLAKGQKIKISLDKEVTLVCKEPFDQNKYQLSFGGFWQLVLNGSAEIKRIVISSPDGINLHQFKHYTLNEEGNWVKYTHYKDFETGSALDFSNLGFFDAPSGKYGWLQSKDGDFCFEGKPEKPVRFNGINLCGTANFLSHYLADALIDRLVKSGINSIRIHHHDNFLPDKENWDRLDYLVAAGIKKGIYFTTDMFVSRKIKCADIGLEGNGYVPSRLYKQIVGFYEPAFEDWCRFSRMFMEHVNPYTGRAYKDEPALNLISLVNENRITNSPELDHPLMQQAWERFGGKGKFTRSVPEFTAFEDYLHKITYEKCAEFMRSIGCRALLTIDNNGQHHDEANEPAKLYDYIDSHFYVDAKRGLFGKPELPLTGYNLNTVYTKGVRALNCVPDNPTKPQTVTEWNYCGLNKNRSLGGMMTGALASVKGFDGLWRFAYSHSDRDVYADKSSHPTTFNLATDPVNNANHRAFTCLFLRNDISSSEGLIMDTDAGSLKVISDRSCGFFCYGGEMTAGPLRADVSGAPASLWVSSLDEQSISKSKRLLLVHVTNVFGEGAKFADELRDIVLSWGSNCMIEKGRASVSLALENPSSYLVYELRGDGKRMGLIKTKIISGHLTFDVNTDGPAGGRMYYEIVKK